MTALTENRNTKEREARLRRYPILASEIIYAGGIAAVNTSTGELEMASDKANLLVAGRAEEYVDNSADGLYAAVKTGCFLFDNSSSHAVTSAHLGRKCYVEDDKTVSSNAGTNGVVAGVVFEVDSNGVWVVIDPPAILAGEAFRTAAAAQADGVAIVDSSGGTASATHTIVAPASTDYTTTELKANFATLAAEHNALKDVVAGLVDKLQAAGLMAS
jgi:hypothetical protein